MSERVHRWTEAAVRLAALRRRAKLSQRDLATRAGITQSQVSRVEGAVHEPAFTTIARVAAALGVSLDRFDTPVVGAPAQPVVWRTCAARLAELRREAALSQRELAARAKVTQAQVSRIETGAHEPGFTTVAQIARALQVSVDVLAGPESEFRQAMWGVRALTTPFGKDPEELPVAIRRDQALCGGPHSAFSGPLADRLARDEVCRRAAAGKPSICLVQSAEWRSSRFLSQAGAQISTPELSGPRRPVLVMPLIGGEDACRAAGMLRELPGRYPDGVLVVVDVALTQRHASLRDVVDGLLREGRKYKVAVNLTGQDAPRWALANTRQTLRNVADTAMLDGVQRRQVTPF